MRTVLIIFHHVELFAKHKVAHDVVGDIRAPVAHIFGSRPFSQLGTFSEMPTPGANILENEDLGRPNGTVGKGMVEYTSPKSVPFAVDLAVRAHGPCARIQGSVPFCLLHVCFSVGIDFFQSWNSVDRNSIWANPNDGTCFDISDRESR